LRAARAQALCRASTPFFIENFQDVDARDKRGHDEVLIPLKQDKL
jgi:hypothetical protein